MTENNENFKNVGKPRCKYVNIGVSIDLIFVWKLIFYKIVSPSIWAPFVLKY